MSSSLSLSFRPLDAKSPVSAPASTRRTLERVSHDFESFGDTSRGCTTKVSEYKIMPTDMMKVSDSASPTMRTRRALISELVSRFLMAWSLRWKYHSVALQAE